MKELWPGQFENFPNEMNVFAELFNSTEYKTSYSKILKIIQRLIRDVLNPSQKRILLLFLDNNSILNISRILNINNSTVHQNYNLIIKKVSLALVNDKCFLKELSDMPEYLREQLILWIQDVKEKYHLFEYICPVCLGSFGNKNLLKKHIIDMCKENDKKYIKYYEKQIQFVKKNLKKYGFSIVWIKENQNEILFSMSWIWNYWKKYYAKKFEKSIFRIFKKRHTR